MSQSEVAADVSAVCAAVRDGQYFNYLYLKYVFQSL